VTDLLPVGVEGSLADAIREADAEMSAFQLVLVVGGGEFGPRSWVEQVGTRLPSLPIAAIVPTFAQPELAPYLRSGQLVALLGTVRDGAAYAADVGVAEPAPERVPSALAMLLGMLIALGALGRTVAAGLWGVGPAPGDSAGTSNRRRGGGREKEADAATDTANPDVEAAPEGAAPGEPGAEADAGPEADPAEADPAEADPANEAEAQLGVEPETDAR
jgi:hypothetical protein